MKATDFFRDRVDQFENERKFFADYVSLTLPDKRECHNLGWENRKLEDASSSAKVAGEKLDLELSQIKAQIASTHTEIAFLRMTKEKRQQQISRLADLAQPIEHDITYIVPEKFTKSNSIVSKKTQLLPIHDPLKKNNPYKLPRTGEITRLENRLATETMRTSSFLQELYVSLRAAEDEQVRVNAQKNEEAEALYAQARAQLEEVGKYDIQCFLAVSELLKLRQRIMVAQREEVEEVERLRVDKRYFADKEEKTREQLMSDMSLMKRRIRSELEESNIEFQKQLATLDTQIRALHVKEASILEENSQTNMYEGKLLTALKEAKDRYNRLRRRNALEIEGYQSEAAQLRSRLAHVEKLHKWRQLQSRTAASQHVNKLL